MSTIAESRMAVVWNAKANESALAMAEALRARAAWSTMTFSDTAESIELMEKAADLIVASLTFASVPQRPEEFPESFNKTEMPGSPSSSYAFRIYQGGQEDMRNWFLALMPSAVRDALDAQVFPPMPRWMAQVPRDISFDIQMRSTVYHAYKEGTETMRQWLLSHMEGETKNNFDQLSYPLVPAWIEAIRTDTVKGL